MADVMEELFPADVVRNLRDPLFRRFLLRLGDQSSCRSCRRESEVQQDGPESNKEA